MDVRAALHRRALSARRVAGGRGRSTAALCPDRLVLAGDGGDGRCVDPHGRARRARVYGGLILTRRDDDANGPSRPGLSMPNTVSDVSTILTREPAGSGVPLVGRRPRPMGTGLRSPR